MTIHIIKGIRVRTDNVCPPIPVRDMDWSAVDDNTYDCDCDEDGYHSSSPIGHGATEQEAIDDLMEQLDE